MKKLSTIIALLFFATACNHAQAPATSNSQPSANSQDVKISCQGQQYKNFGIILSCPNGFTIDQFQDLTAIYKNDVELSFFDSNNSVNMEGAIVGNLLINTYTDPFNASIENYIKGTSQCGYTLKQQTAINGTPAYVLNAATGCGTEEVAFAYGKLYEFSTPVTETKNSSNSIMASVQFYSAQ
jgi:hypothetical protein